MKGGDDMTDVKKQQPHTQQPPEPMQKAGKKIKEATQKGGKGGASAMMGAAAGAVAGATLGGIAGAALSDEKTRKTVAESISNIAKTANETAKRLDANQDKVANTIKDKAGTIKETAESMQKSDTKKS